VHDLAIILVSHSEARWLRPCLTSVFEHGNDLDALDVVVVCNGDDGSAELIEDEFPSVRVIRSENRGFAHACNTGLRTCDSRYVLLQNVDTEVRTGSYADLVRAMDERPQVGAAGVVQVGPNGEVLPTIRNFPSVTRAFAEALASERWPIWSTRLGERVLELDSYDAEQTCDWVSGSFLALRREALEDVGLLDERFFLYSEEPDLCIRLKRDGWHVRHLPVMTILHHANRSFENSRLEAQNAYARHQFAEKHFSLPRRLAFDAALALGYGVRGVLPFGDSRSAERRRAARASFCVVVGSKPPPFESLSHTSHVKSRGNP
jgi:hypothetical protein